MPSTGKRLPGRSAMDLSVVIKDLSYAQGRKDGGAWGIGRIKNLKSEVTAMQ